MRRSPHKNRRPRRTLASTEDRQSARKFWLMIFVLLSLLAHVLLVVSLVLIARHQPRERLLAQETPPPDVTLTLQAPPPVKPDFMPTQPDPGAPPQKSQFISDNDTRLKSRNRVSRAPDVPLPDVTGHKHLANLNETPASPPTKNPAPNPSPPTPEQQQQPPQPPTPAKPTPQTKPTPPQPDQPSSLTPPATPMKASPQKALPQDPNGLPVLPPIDAPTLAPQVTAATPDTPQIQRHKSATPPPSFAVHQSDVSGAAGMLGDNSAQAMATDLGRYKARVYSAVGSRWYAKVEQQLQVLGVGTVHITYTIHSDGHMEIVADPDQNNASLMLLHSLSLNAMLEASPFPPFSDAMKRDVGESYTDDFTFSIYGD